ncbi:hypothetical protein SG0102_25320 [Intestinibaculum porci]|uniref:Uncharacterized protein n=1 Tax=Intestinibaculum porci TaxID=2487118 RepID=A0A3G9JSX8_9FIRM|nr:hypothetical protein [Intestinibaculum porci]BBH27598.1 hypothetical protein SG0102_25320 [Intestinibaculum porci]
MQSKNYLNVISLYEFEKILEMFDLPADDVTALKILLVMRRNIDSLSCEVCQRFLVEELFRLSSMKKDHLAKMVHYFASYASLR